MADNDKSLSPAWNRAPQSQCQRKKGFSLETETFLYLWPSGWDGRQWSLSTGTEGIWMTLSCPWMELPSHGNPDTADLCYSQDGRSPRLGVANPFPGQDFRHTWQYNNAKTYEKIKPAFFTVFPTQLSVNQEVPIAHTYTTHNSYF